MRRFGPLRNIEAWRAASGQEILAAYEAQRHGKLLPSAWRSSGLVSPLLLYSYLKSRFGPPMGFAMAVRDASTDNLVQWNYAVISDGSLIDFLGTNRGTEVLVHARKAVSERQWKTFERRLAQEIDAHKDQLSAVTNGFEKWVLFVNPYHRLGKITGRLETELRGVSVQERQAPVPTRATKEEAEKWLEEQQEHGRNVERAQTLSLSLRMIVPVLAESFVNLVIFVLGRSDIRSDKRLYENVLRAQIDVRVKSLHINCNGFASPVDGGNGHFQNFCRLMDNRNRLLHGNIDPKSLQFDQVFFDQRTIPLFEDEASLLDRMYRSALRHIEPEAATQDLQVARGFIDYILGLLKPDVRPWVEGIMNNPWPGWHPDKKRAGILFSDAVVMSFPGR